MYVLCTLKIKIESPNLEYGWSKDSEHWAYTNQDQDAKLKSGKSSIFPSPKSGLQGHGCSLHLQNKDWAKIPKMGISKTSDHIQIKIRLPHSSEEPPASSKDPNDDLIDMDVLCIFKIKLETWYLEHSPSKTRDHTQMKINMPNHNQEPPASLKASYVNPNQDAEP